MSQFLPRVGVSVTLTRAQIDRLDDLAVVLCRHALIENETRSDVIRYALKLLDGTYMDQPGVSIFAPDSEFTAATGVRSDV